MTLARIVVCNPVGEHFACLRAAETFGVLDLAGIDYDPRETARRAAMLSWLFPWAYCRFIRCPEAELGKWVQVRGLEHLESATESERGVLLLGCHFGPGHMVETALAASGYKVHNLRANDGFHRKYRLTGASPRLPREYYLKNDSTAGRMQTMTAIRDLLRRGHIIKAALDGYVGDSGGVSLPLLGRERVFRTALPLVAASAGARIMPVFTVLNEDGRIKVCITPPLPERGPEEDRLEYAESVVRSYVDKVQAFCESEPGHVKWWRVAEE